MTFSASPLYSSQRKGQHEDGPMCSAGTEFLGNPTSQTPRISALTRGVFVLINPNILQPFSTGAEKLGGRVALSHSVPGECWVTVRVWLPKNQRISAQRGARAQLRSPFISRMCWNSLPHLPPCSSGLLRKHLDVSRGKTSRSCLPLEHLAPKAAGAVWDVFVED